MDTTQTNTGNFKAAADTARAAGKWHGGQWIRQDAREAVYLRGAAALGGFVCTYCRCALTRGGRSGSLASLDHVVPHVLGGSNAPTNLVSCCSDCNSLRKDLSVDAFAAILAGRGVDVGGIAERIEAQTSVALTKDLRAAGKVALAARKAAAKAAKTAEVL